MDACSVWHRQWSGVRAYHLKCRQMTTSDITHDFLGISHYSAPAEPNKVMYYILFYVIFTIRPWHWWLILLQWNLYVFNQIFFFFNVDSSLNSGFKWCRTDTHYAEITLVERRMKLGTQPFPKVFRVYPRHVLSHAQIAHVFIISQKRPDSVFNYHKPFPCVFITVKSP